MALALVSPPPAWTSTTSGTSLTTAAFTPPAGALLLSLSTFGTANAARTEVTDTVTGSTSAWTKVVHQNVGAGLADINWATVTSSTSTTVRTTWPVAFDGALGLLAVTGQRTTNPVPQSGSGQSVTGGGFSITVTPTVSGSRIYVAYCATAGAAPPTAAGMTLYGSSQSPATSSTHASYISGSLSGATTFTFTGGTANAAYSWVEVVPATASAAGPDISSLNLKEAILRFVSTVENGNQQWWTHFGYIEYGAGIGDTRGYTGGIVGWTTATFDMNVLIKAYQTAKPGNILEKWIPTLNTIDAMATQQQRHEASLSQLGAAFVADFQTAGNDPVFQQTQINERDRLYWTPAYNLAVTDGMSPLGLLHYYDCSVNHGQGASTVGGQSFQGIVATAKSTNAPPSEGGNEGTYLTAFNNARQVVLEAWGDYQLDGRVPACRAFVTAGNFGLVTPYSWNMYGTTHTITAWPDPYVLPTPPAEVPAVGYRSGATGVAGANTALAVTKPAGLAAGDLMIGPYVADRDASSGNLPAPAGWTIAGTLDRTSGTPDIGALRIFWKIASTADAAATSFSWPSPGNVDTAGAILAFPAGTFNPTAPIADLQFGVAGTAATTHTAPSATGVAGGMLLNVFARADGSNPSATVTWTTTAANLRTQQGSSGHWVGLATATTPLTTSGATGTKSATATDSAPALLASIVIAPTEAAEAGTRNIADSAGATDTVTRSLAMVRTATSAAGASDAVTLLKGKAVSSSAGASDSFTRTMTMVRPISDYAPTTDHASWTMDRPDIDNYQFVFDAEPWVPFGLGQTVVVQEFNPGGAEIRSQDVLSPTADVRWFGTDRRTPPTWAFDLYTDVETAGDALGWAQNIEEVWDAEELRSTPNAVVALRYKIADRIRRVYGRPGNFEIVPSFVRTGRVHMVADFRLAEHTYYDDLEHRITVRTVASDAAASGFTFPITFPLTIGSQGDSPIVEQAVVEGKRATWIDVTLHGPSLDPWVQIGGQRWQLDGVIGAGESIRMSGKPWQQGLLRSDGAWMAGMLGPQARLSQLRLKPGNYPVKYGAYDPTGTSRAEVAWRAAYGTM